MVGVDLLLFSLSSNTALFAGTPTLEPTTAQAAAVLGTNGRFAIYDTTASNTNVLSQIGPPDLNAFTGLLSVQGYGSIVDSTYGSATGAHLLDTLDPCALARGVFTPLRLNTLLTLSRFLAPPVPPGRAEQAQAPVVGTSSDSCPGAPAPGTARSRTLYLGQVLGVTSAHIVTSGEVAVRVGVLRPSGTTVYPEASVTRGKTGGTCTLPIRRSLWASWCVVRARVSRTARRCSARVVFATTSWACCRTHSASRAGGTTASGRCTRGSSAPPCDPRCGSPARRQRVRCTSWHRGTTALRSYGCRRRRRSRWCEARRTSRGGTRKRWR